MRELEKDHSGGLTSVKDLSDRFCPRPFNHAEIHTGGRVYQCCPAWVPQPIGDYAKQGLPEIWNSPQAREVRASILDGSFRHCQRNWCPDIQGDRLPRRNDLPERWKKVVEAGSTDGGALPETVVLCYDESCNLSCPSCRTQKINYPPSSIEFARSMVFTKRLLVELTSHSESKVNLHVAGLGDPFAAPVFRRLLEGLDGERLPLLRIDLKTNGILLTPEMWTRISRLHRNITTIIVSIDAATPETYRELRRGGEWEVLVRNMRHLVEEKKSLGFIMNAAFVVQRRNYREIADFARFFLDLGFDEISYLLVDNFGAWGTQENFERQCIWRTDQPEFPEFLKVLRDPVLGLPSVQLGGLTEYRRRALAGS